MAPQIIVILLAALLLRLIAINQSLWLDEATTALTAQNLSYSEILTALGPKDFHPPLYYLLIKAWASVFGTSEVALRVPSIIFDLGTIYLLFKIGTRLNNKVVGIIAALLMATGPLAIYYAQEARMYSLTALLVSWSVLLFLKLLAETNAKRGYILGLSLALIFLTDYVALFILPAFWLYVLLFKRKRELIYTFLKAHLLLIIAVIFWWPILSQQLTNGLSVKENAAGWWEILGKVSFKNIVLVPIKFLIGRISFDNKLIYASVVGFAASVYGLAMLNSLRLNKKPYFTYIWLTVPTLVTIIVSFFIPVLYYFRLLFVLPAFYLLTAFGIANLKKYYSKILLACLVTLNLLFSLIYLTNNKFHREDWRGLVELVEKESMGKSAQVIFVKNSQTEAYKYYQKSIVASGPDELDYNSDLVWLMRYVHDVFDPKGEVLSRVENAGFERVKEYNFNGVVVFKYKNAHSN